MKCKKKNKINRSAYLYSQDVHPELSGPNTKRKKQSVNLKAVEHLKETALKM